MAHNTGTAVALGFSLFIVSGHFRAQSLRVAQPVCLRFDLKEKSVSETPLVAPRVSIWHHACSVIVIGLFGAGAFRLS